MPKTENKTHPETASDADTENGRLYDKKGELVKGFFWWDEEFVN